MSCLLNLNVKFILKNSRYELTIFIIKKVIHTTNFDWAREPICYWSGGLSKIKLL